VFVLTLAVVVSGCLLAYLFIPFIHDRVNDGFTDIVQYAGGSKETSMGWRFLMWKAALSMFLSNPVFGIGTGDYVVTMHRYIEAGAYPTSLLQFNQPHNMYLFALATNGLFGLGALLFIFYRIIVLTRSFRNIPPGQQQLFFLATAVAIHYLVAGMTDSLFNIFILRSSFAFVMGICIRAGSVQPAGNG
jgi:O-antigen ligase